jgi:phage terminase Nu1 subunit (DNA packaging protein)
MTHNQRFIFSKQELAQMRNVSVQAVTGWVQRGCPTLGKNGRVLEFYLPDVIDWLITRESVQSGIGTAQAEKARLDRLRADEVEFNLSVKRAEYVPTDAVKYAIADFAGQAAAIVEALPKKVKNSMPSLRAREMKILGKEISGLRNALASIQIRFNTDNN